MVTTKASSPNATAIHCSFPPSSEEGWRLQPAGGGPARHPVGVPVHPGASGWSGYWWLKWWLRPCRIDETLTRRLGRQELASHMSRSKVKHTIMGVSLNSAAVSRWPVVFSSWLDRPVWLAHSWIFESWMPTRLLVETRSWSTMCCSHGIECIWLKKASFIWNWCLLLHWYHS